MNYKILIAGSFVTWSENRNQGNDFSKDLNGKKVAFLGDPQIWVKCRKSISIGSSIYLFYDALTPDDKVQVYPTLTLKNQL